MDALLLAVLNALWQGAALIAVVALALRAGLRRNATTACVVWSFTFLVVALLPALDLAVARPQVAPLADTAAPVTAPARARDAAGAAAAISATSSAAHGGPAIAPVRAALSERVRRGAIRLGGAATTFVRAWGLALLCVWALVAGVLLVRLARGYAAVARMKRDATPLDDAVMVARLRAAGHRRRAVVAQSHLVDVPCAVGFARPMILVPARLAASLDADDLARVVLHESAHLQRYDDWLNALEQVVCALQFFQPALHVARRGIDFEREVACDDRVLAAAGEPLRYAECLARIVQRRVRGPRVAVAPGFVVRRADVVGRVRRIVDRSRDASPRLRFAAVAATAIVLAATLGIARLQVPVVAAASAATAPVTARFAATPSRAGRVPTMRAQTVSAAHRTSTSVHVAHAASSYRAGAAHESYAVKRASITITRSAPPAKTAALAASVPAAPGAPAVRAAPVAHLAPAVARAPVAASARALPAAAESVAMATEAVAIANETVAAANETGSGGDLLAALEDAKYPRPSVDDLISLRTQGISADYIRRMGALVHPRPSLQDLITFAVQGVTPEYVAGVNRRLVGPPTTEQIIGVRVQGVSVAWLDGLAAAGYTKLSAADAISLAVQGISGAWVRGLVDAGMRNLTPSQLIALRVQGIDGAFVRRVSRGSNNLSVDELIRLKVSGF